MTVSRFAHRRDDNLETEKARCRERFGSCPHNAPFFGSHASDIFGGRLLES